MRRRDYNKSRALPLSRVELSKKFRFFIDIFDVLVMHEYNNPFFVLKKDKKSDFSLNFHTRNASGKVFLHESLLFKAVKMLL